MAELLLVMRPHDVSDEYETEDDCALTFEVGSSGDLQIISLDLETGMLSHVAAYASGAWESVEEL